MSMTVTFGWWLVPAFITIALLLGWRLFGPRMEPNSGGMFPDFTGGLIEGFGYVAGALLSAIVWLIWALLR